MILEQGDKILIAHRRMFPEDAERYFIGTIEAYDRGIVRVNGRTWARSRFGGAFIGKPDERTKVVSVHSAALIIYRLPRSSDVGRMELVVDGDRAWLREGSRTLLDLTETY